MKDKKHTANERIATLEKLVGTIYYQQKELVKYILEKQKEDEPKEIEDESK
tara:strand:+ start:680 stop:832 length:153 start_codon:yes stop_codon:yes gene_type:complete